MRVRPPTTNFKSVYVELFRNGQHIDTLHTWMKDGEFEIPEGVTHIIYRSSDGSNTPPEEHVHDVVSRTWQNTERERGVEGELDAFDQPIVIPARVRAARQRLGTLEALQPTRRRR